MTKTAVLIGILLCICLSASAGCITEDPGDTIYPNLQPEMSSILNSISTDIELQSAQVSSHMHEISEILLLSEPFGYEFETIIARTYAEIPDAIRITYLDYATGRTMSYPQVEEEEHFSYPRVTGGDVKLLTGIITTQWHGNIMLAGVPVYDKAGTLCGGLYCAIETQSLPNRAVSMHPESKGYYLTLDAADTKITLYDPLCVAVGNPVCYTDADVAAPAGSYTYIDSNGRPVAAVYERITIYGKEIIASLNIRNETARYIPSSENSSRLSSESMTAALRSVYTYAGSHTETETKDHIEKLTAADTAYPVFMIKRDGRIIASSTPGMNDWNVNSIQDAYSVPASKLNAVFAMQGGGYTFSYLKQAPDTAVFEGLPILNYVMMLDSETYLLSYMPLSSETESVDIMKKYNVTSAARDALLYRMKYGEEELYNAMTAKEMGYPSEIEYIAISANGIIRADSRTPEFVGLTAFGITDAYKNSVTRAMVALGKSGGGCMYYCVADPKGKKMTVYLGSVEPLYDSSFIGTMVPVSVLDMV